MRKFLTKILFYIAILAVTCFMFQHIIDEGLKHYNSSIFNDWNKLFQGSINSEIIILGSSRASGHFNPRIIENKIGYSCYNLGIGAGKIILEEARWESLLRYNKPPKILIQNVDIFSSRPEKYIVFKEQFLPYLSEPTIYQNLKKIDDRIYLERIIPLYKYRGFRGIVTQGFRSFFNIIKNPVLSDFYKGYYGHRKEWNQDFEKFKAKNNKLVFSLEKMKLGINHLNSLIKKCKEKNIDIILVQTPMYFELQNMVTQKNYFDSTLSWLAKKYNVPFLNYSKDPLSYDRKYFYNSLHLNDIGANIFTEKLADSLNVILSKSKISRLKD